MKRFIIRVSAVFLAAALFLSIIPQTVYANTKTISSVSITNDTGIWVINPTLTEGENETNKSDWNNVIRRRYTT